ncbi:MAG: IscS subfamily cysteine desulfurase [Planctomycetes bacterium]|nr:IscS subfamily cysteine desulfurase [Planctomycetota bacterium]
MERIYLDHHATTPIDPRVLDAMMPYLRDRFGNAASRTHAFGREAHDAVEAARTQVAALIGAQPEEIVFTSGATESDNLAIKGVMDAYRSKGDHVVTVATEHKAVLDPCRALERDGRAMVTYLLVDSDGLLDPDRLRSAITDRTVLVSVMAANNEIGVLQDIAAIGAICRERGVLFHADAAQAAGKIPIDVNAMNVGLASLSAHKMYGPKGIGAVYIRRHPRVKLVPMMDGGGHEGGLRSGTLNVPAIVGFGRACEISGQEMADESKRLLALRERLWGGLSRLDRVRLNGHPTRRLPGNLNVSFEFVESESLIEALPDIAVSSTAACTTATPEPSHVLRAIGLPEPLALGAIRFGLGRFTTEAEIDTVIERITAEVVRLRGKSPLYAGKS